MDVQQATSSSRATERLRYPEIADHGLIRDLQTAALVAVDGTINWHRCPGFDSPSVFASLVDYERGGHFRIGSANECVTKQLHLPSTAVLVTRFMTDDGVGEVLDFMPIDEPRKATERSTGWLPMGTNQPDEGIWEIRGGRQHFTCGRLMSRVAPVRMVRIAREHALPTDLTRLITETDRIYDS